MLSELNKQTIQAIVNVFETGSPAGNYANITLVLGDPGHLTFGRSQATLSNGNLATLLGAYCNSTAAAQSAVLRPYLPRLEARDTSLDTDATFRSVLSQSAADPVMRRIQDDFFDRSYWLPAQRAAAALPLSSSLAIAVVYDSFVHGAWGRLRDATLARFGRPSVTDVYPPAPGEAAWVRGYISLRRDWLANHPNPLLRRAVYRMDTFAALVRSGNWNLTLPLVAHGVTITQNDLTGSAEAAG